MDMLIRNLDANVHAELVQRARASDMSLRAYVREVLCEHVGVPSITQWLDHVAGLAPVDADGVSGADLIAATRADDDALTR